MILIGALFLWLPLESSSSHNCKIAAAVLNILNVPDLRPVKPDLLIGLASERIRIAQSASLPSLHVAIKSYLFERGHVAYEISQCESNHTFVKTLNPSLPVPTEPDILSDHFFSFFFVELKGPSGSAGEARIQNSIACNVSLRMHLHLAKLARNADPDSFRPPGEMMLRVYGLQTGGGGSQWKLVVAVADVGRNTTEGMGRLDPVAELDEAENALELRSVVSFYFEGVFLLWGSEEEEVAMRRSASDRILPPVPLLFPSGKWPLRDLLLISCFPGPDSLHSLVG